MRVSISPKSAVTREFFRSRLASMLRAHVSDVGGLAGMFLSLGSTYCRALDESRAIQAREALQSIRGAARILRIDAALDVCYHHVALVTVDEILPIPTTKQSRRDRQRCKRSLLKSSGKNPPKESS